MSLTPWQKIMRAASKGAGLRLTAAETRSLSRDDAISQVARNDDQDRQTRKSPPAPKRQLTEQLKTAQYVHRAFNDLAAVLQTATVCVQETATVQPWFTQTIRTAGPRWRDQNHPPECSCFFCNELTRVL